MDTQPPLIDLVRSLRAVRRFSPQPVADEALSVILDVGRWTGSAKNTQPWQLIVVRERDTLRALATCGAYASHLAGAQVAIVLVMDDEQRRFDEGRLAHNLMLAAWAFGIGSCIASMNPEANKLRARELLGVPEGRWLHTAISFGYPADAAATRLSADRSGLTEVPIGRLSTADFVSWERFDERSR